MIFGIKTKKDKEIATLKEMLQMAYYKHPKIIETYKDENVKSFEINLDENLKKLLYWI